MISQRPSIFIYAYQPDPDFLREIQAGIEEEGIHSEVFLRTEVDVNTLAHQAAEDSMLGSGIGLSGVDAALQMRRLPSGQNVHLVHMPTYEQCRRIGSNSARIIKKLPIQDLNA